MAPRARVVVSAFNQVAQLRRALRGYLRQTERSFTLALADDGSSDATPEYLRTFAEDARAAGIGFEYHRQEDRGFRKTRILNQALRHHRGEPLVIFSDGDCIPPAHFVEKHLERHEPRSFHVGGSVALDEETSARLTETDVDSGRFETLVTPEDRRLLRRRARQSRWGTWLRRRHRPKVVGRNMALDLTLLESLNGFDERFVGYGFEDSDLRDRAMRHRPRPRVKILYGANDVFHLWHPPRAEGREPNRSYYARKRPVRCEHGLHPHGRKR